MRSVDACSQSTSYRCSKITGIRSQIRLLLLLLAAPTWLKGRCGRHNSPPASSVMDFIFRRSGGSRVSVDTVSVSVFFAFFSRVVPFPESFFLRSLGLASLSHCHTGSYDFLIVRLVAILRTCDQSSMFATISGSGRSFDWWHVIIRFVVRVVARSTTIVEDRWQYPS